MVKPKESYATKARCFPTVPEVLLSPELNVIKFKNHVKMQNIVMMIYL